MERTLKPVQTRSDQANHNNNAVITSSSYDEECDKWVVKDPNAKKKRKKERKERNNKIQRKKNGNLF